MTRRFSRYAASLASSQAVPQPKLDLSSLVDIAFLLLTFFLLTATLDPREVDLGLKVLPTLFKGGSESEFIPEELRVQVKADGSVWCGEEMVEGPAPAGRRLPELLNRLRMEGAVAAMGKRAGGSGVVVNLSAEDEVSGQRLLDVLDCVTEARIDQVRLEGFVE
ncbi:MAG: biopolymer transporter ExbD [Verrucomicrobiae bacterium]|nr:biopolymer transporter ExbD [Verrucomicrobiae bacterium]MCB1086993.1 biopolymer transporter ExbD [Verrucomicrobiae bacterium]